MYETLVAALRKVDEYDSGYAKLMYDAADAIDELTRENESLAKSVNEASEILRRRWIPVTERLPSEFGRYLCRYRIEDSETIGYCTDFGRYDPEYGGWFVGTVTHWMPLPQPPKEET